jgi:hypothetical protein
MRMDEERGGGKKTSSSELTDRSPGDLILIDACIPANGTKKHPDRFVITQYPAFGKMQNHAASPAIRFLEMLEDTDH